jgi:hypothetical protein
MDAKTPTTNATAITESDAEHVRRRAIVAQMSYFVHNNNLSYLR